MVGMHKIRVVVDEIVVVTARNACINLQIVNVEKLFHSQKL